MSYLLSSHEKAIKSIGCFLKAITDQVLILTPIGQLKVDAYPDADFSGLCGHEKSSDHHAQKVRLDS